MQRVEAAINPELMRWAREKSGYRNRIEDAAQKIGRTVEELKAWESGKSKPTLAQVRKASEVYKRPLAVFFLPEPPKDFDTLRDFRRLPKDIPKEYSPNLAYIIRRIQNRQRWLSEFLQSEGYPPLEFLYSPTTDNNPVSLADKIRNFVGITPKAVFQCRSREEALRLWIDETEHSGIYVCQAGNLKHERIDVEEARGATLADKYAPFIFLNARDAKAAQLFTLAHELVHLWINEPGLSNLVAPRRPNTDTEKIEIFCNIVAAEILVPQVLFKSLMQTVREYSIEEQIRNLSIKFKVSQEVIARRLLDFGNITQKTYMQLARKFRQELIEQKEKEEQEIKTKKVIINYNLLKIINNGRTFTKTVINAYKNGEISGIVTANLLEMKLNKLPTVADMLHLPLTGRRTAT